MKAYQWIERLKIAKGWESDYRVAKELGLTRGAISRYRNTDGGLDEDVCIHVAELLELRPAEVLLDQMRERSKSAAAKDAIGEVLRKIGGGAASILLAAGLVGSPTQVRATIGNSGVAQAILATEQDIHRLK